MPAQLTSVIERRNWIAAAVALMTGPAILSHWPFSSTDRLSELVFAQEPLLWHSIREVYVLLCFTTPYITVSVIGSLLYIFVLRLERPIPSAKLTPYPDPAGRERLFLILGEAHHRRRSEPVLSPSWIEIPERGLYTGIAILGAIGSGKTSGCMYPFAEQILAYRASDAERRIGGLILEVKGDFCYKVRSILEKYGRASDYLEISLNGDYRYNPLYGDLDAYALAFGIASLLNNLYGKGKEPFWQQAYTNMVKFVIILHKILRDYVTLFDIYQGAINPDYLEGLIKEGEQVFGQQVLLIEIDEFLAWHDLEKYPFEMDAPLKKMRAPLTDALQADLKNHGIAFEIQNDSNVGQESGATHLGHTPGNIDNLKGQQFEAVKRWFYQDWMRIDSKLRTSIVEGISVFLSLFDDNPAVKRIFCPPKETYDPDVNHDGRYGKPLPPFAELIEMGAICALNFPVSANPGMAKVIGVLMKQDFQRAVLNRIPKMEQRPTAVWRQTLFLCDEYHSFATAGENDPSGDEKFFALSRQARCIAIVATQSISSLRSTLPGETWRTLLQTFRTKIFLALADDFTAKCASELCGEEEQLKLNYGFSENGLDAGVSVLTGRAAAQRTTLSTTKGYNVQRDFVFEPKIFSELKNAQAIVLVYDGLNPHPPRYAYLKPYYLDPNKTYFEQLAQGLL